MKTLHECYACVGVRFALCLFQNLPLFDLSEWIDVDVCVLWPMFVSLTHSPLIEWYDYVTLSIRLNFIDEQQL